MSSIGPTLPPHLQKSRQQAASSDSDDEGPQPPAPSVTQEQDEDEEDDDFGPALPPHLAAARKIGPVMPPSAEAGPSRPVTVGPTLPSAAGPSRGPVGPIMPGASRYDEDDDDDDYEVGPSLAGAMGPQRSAAEEFMEREARWAKEREEAAKPKQMKREEWMLVPPKAGTLADSLSDPLKIKARGFARSADDVPRERDQTLWTETPKEREQRLKDEMLGKKRKLENSEDGPEDDFDEIKRRRRDAAIQDSIKAHNAAHRASAMVDTHSKSKGSSSKSKIGKDDDEPPPIWDRDLHMGVTGKLLGDKDRAKMLKDAKNLGDRFGRGSYA